MNDWSKYTGWGKLAGLLVVLPVVLYSAAIRPNVELHRTLREQTARVETARQDTLRQEFPAEREDEAGREVRNGTILHRLTPAMDSCGVTAERYTPLLLAREADAELYAGELVLSGGFIALTRLLDDIERHPPGGRLVSVRYAAAIDPQTRKKQLQMTLIFQQITPNEPL